MIGSALLALAAQAAAPAAIEGRWLNPKKSVIIVVAPCGARLCGTVEWASDKAQEDARRGIDELIGAQLLTEIEQVGDGRWQGRLFLPDRRMRVKAKLRLEGEELKVSGCAVGKALCKSQLWTRAAAASPAAE